MKNSKLILVVSLILLFINVSYAQHQKKPKIYKTWVTLNSEPFSTTGFLYEIKDSSILVSNLPSIKDFSTDKFQTIELPIYKIETIKTRRLKSSLRGTIIGAVAGIALGAATDLYGDGDKANSIFLGLSYGAGLGALIGLIKVKFPINGSMDNYHRNYNKLKKKALKNN